MFNWTQENFNHAKEQYDLKIPASKIAREIGTTKNAVLGKIHRYKVKHGHKKKGKNMITTNDHHILKK